MGAGRGVYVCVCVVKVKSMGAGKGVCVCVCVRWCDTSTHPFTILCEIFNFVFVLWILVQYNLFMIFLNINVLAFFLHVLLLFF